jgi:hypothetical protein
VRFQRSPVVYGVGPHFLGWFEAKTHLEGQIYGIKIRDWAVDVVGPGSGSWGCLSPEQP